jgi:hypothetical protein
VLDLAKGRADGSKDFFASLAIQDANGCGGHF